MKISSFTSVADLCELQLRLNSTNMKFSCHMLAPANTIDYDRIVYDRNRRACIEFRDTYEIDQLIEMLKRFKRENAGYIGSWERGEED